MDLIDIEDILKSKGVSEDISRIYETENWYIVSVGVAKNKVAPMCINKKTQEVATFRPKLIPIDEYKAGEIILER